MSKNKTKCRFTAKICLSIVKSLLSTYQLITNGKIIQKLQCDLSTSYEQCAPPLSCVDSISNYLVLINLAPALSVSSTLLDNDDDIENDSINSNSMLLLLQSFIDHALSSTAEDHSNAVRTSAASCLNSICILMQSKSDVNINDFMNNVNLDQCLFYIFRWLLLMVIMVSKMIMMDVFLLRWKTCLI